MSDLDAIYTAEWVAGDFKDLQPEFDMVADALERQFHPQGVTDVGCGPGMILRRMWEKAQCQVRGYEGSRHCIEYAHPSIRHHIHHVDLRKVERLEPSWHGKNGLIVCTEVAEHLEPEHADRLVQLLCDALSPIVFTAAPPGQDGHHHVNCQHKDYWIEKFESRGCLWDIHASGDMACRWKHLKRLSHMARNVMVFR